MNHSVDEIIIEKGHRSHLAVLATRSLRSSEKASWEVSQLVTRPPLYPYSAARVNRVFSPTSGSCRPP